MSDWFGKLFGSGGGAAAPAGAATVAAGLQSRSGVPDQLPRMPDILANTNPPSDKGPATIPTPDATSASMQAAARKAAAAALGGAGRMSTILTNPGGRKPISPVGDYSKNTLGAG